jgi:hypothetical protein
MVWNTNDWTTEEEDKHWEMTEEDTDDEFDDIALSRLGVDIPECAREDQFIEPLRVRDIASQDNISELVREWTRTVIQQGVSTEVQTQIMDAMASIQTDTGTFHFGDEPRGIDPERAGFDWEPESCEDCGAPLDECECHMDDFDEEECCQACGLHYSEDCDCEY